MRKLSKEEFEAMQFTGKGGQTVFTRAVAALAVGEVLYLPKEDWKRKYHPGDAVRGVAKRQGRRFEVLREANGKGWAVRRLV